MNSNTISSSYRTMNRPENSSLDRSHQGSKRRKHTPFLLLTLLCIATLLWIYLFVPPASIQDFGAERTFLPVLVIHFLAQAPFWSFVFFHFRRGIVVAAVLTAALYLLFQGILTIYSFGIVVLPLLVFELYFTLLERK